MIKILSVFGTRPEAIKMAPVVKALEKDSRFQSVVAVTAQHREMLDQVLNLFQIQPDYDLNIMQKNQQLADITAKVLQDLTPIIQKEQPALVLVHGDTTTALAAALAAFYLNIPVGHVEAGLRTWNKLSPFPEEMNRQMIDQLAALYFAPTEISKQNLLRELHPEADIHVTGNTAIDTLNYTVSEDFQHQVLKDNVKQFVLVTMHRRENMGKPMEQVFQGVKRIAEEYPDTNIIFPMHRNPQVREIAVSILGELKNVLLIEPLNVLDFHNLAARSSLILTDSGGIQEEAPSLCVPVLVLREETERPEGVEAGTLKLIGTDENKVYQAIRSLLDNKKEYQQMADAKNPYGDGKASGRILEAIFQKLKKEE